MYSAKIQPRQTGPVEFKSEKPYHTVPKIIEELEDETGTVTHYLCEGNRLFVKETYDRIFCVAHGLGIKTKRFNKRNV